MADKDHAIGYHPRLKAILSIRSFTERRKALRDLVTPLLKAHVSDPKSLLERSLLVGDGPDQIKARLTMSGLRDNLCEGALAAIAFDGEHAISLIRNAIWYPHDYGVEDDDTKTGFAFGLHADHPTITTIRDALEDVPAAPTTTSTATSASATSTSATPETAPMTKTPYDISALVAAARDCSTDDLLEAMAHINSYNTSFNDEPLHQLFDRLADLIGPVAEGTNAEQASSRLSAMRRMVYTMHESGDLAAAKARFLKTATAKVAERNDGFEHLISVLVGALNETLQEEAADEAADKAAEEKAPVAIKPSSLKLPKLSSSESTMLDTVLKTVGMPDLSTLTTVISDTARLVEDRASMAAEIEKLRKASLASSALSAVTVEASGGEGGEGGGAVALPKGKVTLRPAHEVFGLARGKDSFSFDVPVWEWEHEHPHVPKKDPNYIFRPIELLKALMGIINNERTYAVGDTGTGKTSLFEQICAYLNWPFFRVNMDSEVTRMDLMGRDTLVSDPETGATTSRFVDGVLPYYMQRPYFLVLDELDFCRSDVAYVMQRALENDALVITEDGGRVVKPHPMFRIVATGNTVGQGDEKGMYQGARVQSMALLNRFSNWIKVDYLDKDSRLSLIKSAAPDLRDTVVSTIARYTTEHMEAFTTAKVFQPITPRDFMALARKADTYLRVMPESRSKEAIRLAFDATILDRATEQDRAVLSGIVDRCVK